MRQQHRKISQRTRPNLALTHPSDMFGNWYGKSTSLRGLQISHLRFAAPSTNFRSYCCPAAPKSERLRKRVVLLALAARSLHLRIGLISLKKSLDLEYVCELRRWFSWMPETRAPHDPAAVAIGLNLASFRRFWAIAARVNLSWTPQGPRNRRRPSLRMRLTRAKMLGPNGTLVMPPACADRPAAAPEEDPCSGSGSRLPSISRGSPRTRRYADSPGRRE